VHLCQRNCDRLENKGSDLLPNIPGWDLRNFRLLGRWDTGDEVHLVPSADLRLLGDLVTEVQGKEFGNVDV